MVISTNAEPNKEVFQTLLHNTISELNLQAEKEQERISSLTGNKLEPYVHEIMSDCARGTNFENTIELIGGQKFPDIIANRLYGVEVKTTTQNHWKTTGNSVLESTRVEDVERIYMLFGKLGNPIEFRSRRYEECLCDVVVTHSPRYLIDMNLKEGQTIFDKMKMTYDDLRNEKNPIRPVVAHYKQNLRPGQYLWWIDEEDSKSSNFVINIWNNLSTDQKKEKKMNAMAFFPEIFSNRADKFARLAIWLATQESIVCPNIRDHFTAGGQGTFSLYDNTFENIPRIFIKLFENIESVVNVIRQSSDDILSYHWRIETSEKSKINDWINLVSENSKTIQDANHLDIRSIIETMIDDH